MFFFKHKTAYELRISDWSSDVCSSVLHRQRERAPADDHLLDYERHPRISGHCRMGLAADGYHRVNHGRNAAPAPRVCGDGFGCDSGDFGQRRVAGERSEEHTSELQSLMRISYAVFCLKKKKNKIIESVSIYTYNNK